MHDRVSTRRRRPRTRSANSSPPKRATVSPARSSPCRRGPIARSSSSPAWWPSESLSTLRLSRSTKSSATRPPSRVARASALMQPVEQQRAVRQAGQRVVERVVAHLLLDPQALDRAAEHVRHRCRKSRSVAERPLGARVGAEHADRLVGLPIRTLTLETTPWPAAAAATRVVRQVLDHERAVGVHAAAVDRTTPSRTRSRRSRPASRTPARIFTRRRRQVLGRSLTTSTSSVSTTAARGLVDQRGRGPAAHQGDVAQPRDGGLLREPAVASSWRSSMPRDEHWTSSPTQRAVVSTQCVRRRRGGASGTRRRDDLAAQRTRTAIAPARPRRRRGGSASSRRCRAARPGRTPRNGGRSTARRSR